LLKIGLLGGSFNPPHQGHIDISQIAKDHLQLDQVWWLVSPKNPLKDEAIYSAYKDRFNNCQEITKSHKYIKVSDLERQINNSNKPNYSYDLLRKIESRFRDFEFYFIIGSDNLLNFHKWYKWQDILNKFNILVVERQGYKYNSLNSIAGKYGNYTFINAKTENISSTEIREKTN
jgi:nicotinate-nucleotide adenylyltransferase